MKISLLPIVVVSMVALSACTSASAPESDTETYVSATDAPTDETTVAAPGPREPDTTVVVTALATAPNGATLSLELRAHSGVRWDDVANQTIPAAFVDECGVSAQQLASETWAFTRANLTALPGDGTTWPADAVITVAPSAAAVDTVGRGILGVDSGCAVEKTFSGPGSGAIAMGISGGAADGSPSPTGWTQHAFGFTSDAGVEFSECSATLTDLGAAAVGAAAWATRTDSSSCLTGTLPERVER